MGYNTEFAGKIEIENDLTENEVLYLKSICGEDVRDHDDWKQICKEHDLSYDLTYIDYELEKDKVTGKYYLEWNYSEKSYQMPEKLELIILLMKQKNPNFIVSGKMVAQGESVGDVWVLKVDKNKIQVITIDEFLNSI